jgi:uncharacterized protein YkwD
MRFATFALIFCLCPGPALAEFDAERMQKAALAQINVQRAQAGCPDLRPNQALQAAALAHATAMAQKNFFAHKGPDGSTMQSRIEAAGYRWRALAENIAAGQDSAAAVVKAWMNSPGHRANIQNCALRDTGLAVVYDAQDQPLKGKAHALSYYWVQTFGSP